MEAGFPLPLPDSQRESLVFAAKDHALATGVMVRMRNDILSQESVTYPPFTLLPSPVPAHCFQAARAVQQHFNLLMHKVAHDHDFMKDCLKETIKVDEFTRQVWQIYESVREEGLAQPLSLALNRSDYMLDCRRDGGEDEHVKPSDVSIKQVEFNTMASSFGGLCDRLSKHHRYMMAETGWDNNENKLPDNGALDGLAEGMLFAWEQYNNPSAVILFVVSDEEWNIYDQRWLEYTVKQQNPKVKVIRRSLQALHGHASLGDNKAFMLDGMEVAVMYFRMTYVPSHFHGPEDWSMRLMMERSRAIKCPSAHYFLAGTKKVQQMLAVPGVLERFLSDSQAVTRIRATFAGQYSLDVGSEGDAAVAMALRDPERFVVKPQREGGGNNVFGEGIRKLLRSLGNSEERNAYILMERIHPAPLQNYVLRPGHPVQLEHLVSELGIFGIVVGGETEVLLNKEQGHILRTKTTQEDEGGVAAGFAALDSPYLI